ncbi:hypothetical protein [Bradyrhizobium sp. Rc3b]|uniref:hypothetical protein n=1 Tax=Bradyrhizobium sp. Rc3b TaxID=1855322 RepID=UPI0011605CC8|nr:hypothetical protein [Bradyrhizobium sp. Rc3b]
MKVSYYRAWHTFEHEGIRLEKKPAHRRAGSSRRGATAGAREKVKGGSVPLLVFIGETCAKDQHDAHRRPREPRRAPDRHRRTLTFLAALRHDALALLV